MEKYVAQIQDGIVVDITVATSGTVGNAEWCIDRLGGLWIDTDTLVGIGWTWDETNGFQPPVALEPPQEQ